MRAVPPDLAIDPIPADFTITTEDDGGVISWRGTIAGQRYALGLRPPRTAAAIAEATEHLRIGAWQLGEFARLGRADLMAYAHPDRHRNRKKA